MLQHLEILILSEEMYLSVTVLKKKANVNNDNEDGYTPQPCIRTR